MENHRILIVEDDEAIAGAVSRIIESWGLTPRCVRDFRDVLREFTDFDPHLVLMDITLPFFNGYHWCSEIRKFSRVPIIFILICYLSNYMARITSCNNMAWNVFYHN